MKIKLFLASFFIVFSSANAQRIFLTEWNFQKTNASPKFKATVPGNIYSDLLTHKQIPDPIYGANESLVQWVDTCAWTYTCNFDLRESIYQQKSIALVLQGVDTYATIWLNGKMLRQVDNMFLQHRLDIKQFAKKKGNVLQIDFHPAKKAVDSISKRQRITLPDNNRVYARKAAYQFGWDWGPTLVGCGIYKPVYVEGYQNISFNQKSQNHRDSIYLENKNRVTLEQMKNSIGESFYFTVDGKPTYMQGANYIPIHFAPGETTEEEYRKYIKLAKAANMNMLRVWGGGVYEADAFYDLCDSAGIYVWQDFMFAGGMYPGDDAFFASVKEEVRQQVLRLRHHKSIVLWCGNNEIEEAWRHWGWQKQFNLHGADSAKIWSDYKRLFQDSIPTWLQALDPKRPYVSTSPKFGWGNEQSYTDGDSHYWGLWWGKADWQSFKTHTGRFVSEYGMQALPTYDHIKDFTDKGRRKAQLQLHQKAGEGTEKLEHYLTRYFISKKKLKKLSVKEYSYLTQCLQYYILKNVAATHKNQYPRNMGSLVWQLNDVWSATSWSLIDYGGNPKGGYYALKKVYGGATNIDSTEPKNLILKNPKIEKEIHGNKLYLTAKEDAYYVFIQVKNSKNILEDNYILLEKGKRTDVGIVSDVKLNDVEIVSLYDLLGG